MDSIDNQLKELFSALNGDESPAGFSDMVLKKIDIKKEQMAKRKENSVQILVLVLSSIGFATCMYMLNKYFFHLEISSVVARIGVTFSVMKEALIETSYSRWTIIGINFVILILLEQLLSRKFYEKQS